MSSGYPRRKDSLRDDNEPAVADSGSEVHYRRMEPSSAAPAMATHRTPFYESVDALKIGACPEDPLLLETDTSAESSVPSFKGYSGPQSESRGIGSSARPSYQQPVLAPTRGPGQDYIDDPQPEFFAPFGSVGKSTTEGSSSYGEAEDPDTPCVITLPSTFRLERTNFVASSPFIAILSIHTLLAALRSSLAEAKVDVLEFKPAHCVLECSFHVGNRFLSMNFRVFRAPDRASGQLLETSNHDNRGDEDEQTPFVVEAQLREGDRLHFSALFREIMREFKNQEGVNLAGTFRYHPRPYGMGEGLALEQANMGPSRNSIRLLAEREESMKSGGAGLGVSPPPVPPSMAKTQDSSELDLDMIDDVVLLANMLRGNFLDVQADAATAVAGLTADPELLEQLSRDGADRAANELCTAAARLLVETQHRPARRQAAVVVANLATTPKLRAALLASDPTPAHTGMEGRLVESLVVLSMGIVPGGTGIAPPANAKEEEIGTRRECMRALVGLAESQAVRNTPMMQQLLATDPAGRGSTDKILMTRLQECRTVLKNLSS